VRFGLFGLFMNGVLSPILRFPPELTSSALIFTGEPKTNVSLVLVLGWIIGGMFGYYLGLSSNKFVKWRHITSSKQNNRRGYKLLMKYGWAIILVSPGYSYWVI
jgi:membrane protein YqaA with SNARE-associated domain